jgi:hypothetical protein
MAMLFRSPPAPGLGLLKLRNRANPMRNPPRQFRPGPTPHPILPFLVCLPASLSTTTARDPFAFDALVRAVLWGAWLAQGWDGMDQKEGQADLGEQTRGPSRCVRWMPVGRCTSYRGGGTGAGWRGERSWTPYALRGGRGSMLRCAGGELSLLRRRTLSHLCGWRGRALSAETYPRSSTGLPSSTSEHHRASLRPPSFNFLASSIRLRRLVLHGARPRGIAFTALHAPTALPPLHTTPRPAHARSRYRFVLRAVQSATPP